MLDKSASTGESLGRSESTTKQADEIFLSNIKALEASLASSQASPMQLGQLQPELELHAAATSLVNEGEGKRPIRNIKTPQSYYIVRGDAVVLIGRDRIVEESTVWTPSLVTIPENAQLSEPELLAAATSLVNSCINAKQIEFIKLGTYQGRLASSPEYDSTNGCAVISPLVVATHISTQRLQQSKYGISNVAINIIIDERAPPILNAVRSKLGLSKDALIIPSDVHDYLVDCHILPQDKFVGDCGGQRVCTFHRYSIRRINQFVAGNSRV